MHLLALEKTSGTAMYTLQSVYSANDVDARMHVRMQYTYSNAKSGTCLFRTVLRNVSIIVVVYRTRHNRQQDRSFLRYAFSLFLLSLVFSLSMPLLSCGGISKRAMKVHRKRKMDVLWWDMTCRHEYLSRPLSNATSRRFELVSTTKLRCTGCDRSCAHSLDNAAIAYPEERYCVKTWIVLGLKIHIAVA